MNFASFLVAADLDCTAIKYNTDTLLRDIKDVYFSYFVLQLAVYT